MERRTFLELQYEQDDEMDIFGRRRAMTDTDIEYDLADYPDSCLSCCGDDRNSKEDDTESTCSGSTGQESCGQAHQSPDMHPDMFASSAAELGSTSGYVWSAVPMFIFVPAFVPQCIAGEQQQGVVPYAPAEIEVDAGSAVEGLAKTAASRRQRKSERKQKAEASKRDVALGVDSTSSVGPTSCDVQDAPTPVQTGDAMVDAVEDSPPTTILIRNLSKDCTRDAMIQVLEAEGYAGSYDMVHVPVGFQDLVGLGHALVNFLDAAIAQDALLHFDGFGGLSSAADLCEAGWSNVQGLAAHVQRYRDSPIMHESIPNQFKPAMFQDGAQVSFPEPTKRLKAPRVRHQKVPSCT